MSDAKPCPWCGSTTIVCQKVDCTEAEPIPVYMECGDCGASGPIAYVNVVTRANIDEEKLKTTALENWNKKPDLPEANIVDILSSNKPLKEKADKINQHYRLLYGRHDFSDYKQLTESLLIQFLSTADIRQLNCIEHVLQSKIERNTKLLEKVKDRKKHDLKQIIGEL